MTVAIAAAEASALHVSRFLIVSYHTIGSCHIWSWRAAVCPWKECDTWNSREDMLKALMPVTECDTITLGDTVTVGFITNLGTAGVTLHPSKAWHS